MRLLLAAGAKPDLSTELFLASIEGNIRRVRAALDKGAEVDSEDYDGGTPLIFTVSRKRIDVVRLLIERGENVNHRNQAGRTALDELLNYDPNGNDLYPYQKRDVLTLRKLFRDARTARKAKLK